MGSHSRMPHALQLSRWMECCLRGASLYCTPLPSFPANALLSCELPYAEKGWMGVSNSTMHHCHFALNRAAVTCLQVVHALHKEWSIQQNWNSSDYWIINTFFIWKLVRQRGTGHIKEGTVVVMLGFARLQWITTVSTHHTLYEPK